MYRIKPQMREVKVMDRNYGEEDSIKMIVFYKQLQKKNGLKFL